MTTRHVVLSYSRVPWMNRTVGSGTWTSIHDWPTVPVMTNGVAA
jgi:hypothetical protein